MFRSRCFAVALAVFANGAARAQPKPKVTDEQMKRWAEKTAALAPAEQEVAFRAKMGELNPKLDTSTKTVRVLADKDGTVREVFISAVYAEDVRPVALYRDLEKLTVLAAVGYESKVADVSCVRGLTKLKELNLRFTSVANLAPLVDLPIEKLLLEGTLVKDIGALKKMPLTEVQLPKSVSAAQLAVLTGKPLRVFETHGHGPDTAKDVKAIFKNAKLETYCVGGSNLESLEPLADMPLKVLELHESPKLKSLAPLKGCITLREFSIVKAPITDLTPLAGKRLERLGLYGCAGVRDIALLKQSPGIMTLDLTGTKVSDLAPLADLKGLRSVSLQELQVKSLSPLADLPQVWQLNLRNTAVADKDFAPVTALPKLTNLGLDITPATEALVKKIPTLERLNNQPVAPPK